MNHTGIISSDRIRYGDLYGISNLSYFRKQYRQDNIIEYPDCNTKRNIDLYAVCDSYVWTLLTSSKFFCGVDKFFCVKTNDKETINAKLDTSKTNILLLEFSERNVSYLLEDDIYVRKIIPRRDRGKASIVVGKKKSLIASVNLAKKTFFDFIFNRSINDNLQYNLWDFSFLRPVKELRANINYQLFDKVDNNVKMATGGHQLYFNRTVDSNDVMSSFRYISEVKKDTLVARLNTIYENAREYGFKRVYLAIIPSTVSILEPHYNGLHYNDLIKRIQDDPKLKTPYINILPEFEHLKNRVYLVYDSHWNAFGASVWLKKFNEELKKQTVER